MDVISLLTLLLNDGSQRVAGRLPAKVDLRPLMSPVETKGETQSSVANAAAGANEYLQKRHLGEAGYDVSRLFVYFNARNREVEGDGAITDSGSCIQDAIAGLQNDGACSEDTWPFDPELVNEPPSDEAYEKAKSFMVEEAQFLPHDLNLQKSALAEGQPIIFAVKLFQSFNQLRRRVVPTPTPMTCRVALAAAIACSASAIPIPIRSLLCATPGRRLGREGPLLYPLWLCDE